MTSIRRRQLWLTATGLLAALVSGACSGSRSDTSAADEETVEAAAGTDASTAQAGADAPARTASGGVAGKPACTGPATATAQTRVTPIQATAEPQLPVTYSDTTGKAVTISDTSRILALDSYGTLATTVYALGFGDRLIGRDISTGIPELANLPLVTHNGHELNGEAILNLRPSLVLTDYSIGPLEVQLQLIDSGIPVVLMSDHRSRAEIGPQIRAVSEVLGVPGLGSQLATKVEADVKAAEARVAAMAPADDADKLRMAFLYVRGAAGVYSWLGKGSGADDLIAAVGGLDVATEVGVKDAQPVNAEGLVKSAPDLLLLMTKGLESTGGVPGLLEMTGIADTKAGQTSCVVDMSDYQVLSFGPQFPAVLDGLAKAIYQQAAPR